MSAEIAGHQKNSGDLPTYLLIANGELSLGLLVCLGVLVELANGLIIQHLLSEAHVALGVLMARVNLGVVWKTSQDFIQRLVHLGCIALEKASAATNEERVPGEHGPVVSVFEIETDAVLSVAWCMKCSDLDVVSDFELGFMCRGL